MNQIALQDEGNTLSIKAIEGKEGFLFLGGRDSNSVSDYLSGEVQLSRGALHVHRQNFAELAALPIPVVFMVVPESHVIYKDLLPDGSSISESRPVRVLQAEFPGRIIYPYDEFVDLRKSGVPVYTGRDTHWSEPASFEGWKILRAAAGLTEPFNAPFEPNSENELRDLEIGDIAEARRRYHDRLRYRSDHDNHLLYANGIANHGALQVKRNPRAPYGRCMLFGTSFSRPMLPCLSMDFREVVFCHATAIDPLVVDILQPDVLFIEQPERFLHFPYRSVSGSVLLSHSLLATPSTCTSVLPAENGPDALIRTLAALIDPATTCMPAQLPGGRRLWDRLNEIRRRTQDVVMLNALRAVLAGSFWREDLMRYLNVFIDAGGFADRPDLLPDTQMGLNGRARIEVRRGNLLAAREAIRLSTGLFGRSLDSDWYEDFLNQHAVSGRI